MMQPGSHRLAELGCAGHRARLEVAVLLQQVRQPKAGQLEHARGLGNKNTKSVKFIGEYLNDHHFESSNKITKIQPVICIR